MGQCNVGVKCTCFGEKFRLILKWRVPLDIVPSDVPA